MIEESTGIKFLQNFNAADSSSFACMIEGSIRFAKQNPFQSCKAPSLKQLSVELLDQAYRSTEQLAALILATCLHWQGLAASAACLCHLSVMLHVTYANCAGCVYRVGYKKYRVGYNGTCFLTIALKSY